MKLYAVLQVWKASPGNWLDLEVPIKTLYAMIETKGPS